MTKLSNYLTQKFRDWEASTGRHQTVTAFARWVGVSQPSMARWMNGDNIPTEAQNINRLTEHFGPEIYDVLGMPQPDPIFIAIEELEKSTGPKAEETRKLIHDVLSAGGWLREK